MAFYRIILLRRGNASIWWLFTSFSSRKKTRQILQHIENNFKQQTYEIFSLIILINLNRISITSHLDIPICIVVESCYKKVICFKENLLILYSIKRPLSKILTWTWYVYVAGNWGNQAFPEMLSQLWKFWNCLGNWGNSRHFRKYLGNWGNLWFLNIFLPISVIWEKADVQNFSLKNLIKLT